MEFKEFRTKLIEKSSTLEIMLLEEQIEKFYKYMNLLIDWNSKINLTAIIEENDIIEKHFVDSLSILKNISNNDKVIDIGTGAGFPGIPLKIVNESLKITLLDSLNKRINFLNEIIKENNLNGINAIHSRAEEFIENNREEYDIAVSRAVASMPTLVEYMLPYIKIGGKCICMKGPNVDEELKTSEKAIKILGGEIEKIENIIINENMNRNIIIIKKIKNTPKEYPRRNGKPSKEPIKK